MLQWNVLTVTPVEPCLPDRKAELALGLLTQISHQLGFAAEAQHDLVKKHSASTAAFLPLWEFLRCHFILCLSLHHFDEAGNSFFFGALGGLITFCFGSFIVLTPIPPVGL